MLGIQGKLTKVDTTNVTASAVRGELREHVHETYGYQIYRLVFNNPGGALAANVFYKFGATSSLNIVAATDNTPTLNVAGLLQTALPDQHYGWALVYGDGLATADAAISDAAPLTIESSATAVAGAVDDTAVATLEHTLVGVARAAPTVAGTFRMFVNVL